LHYEQRKKKKYLQFSPNAVQNIGGGTGREVKGPGSGPGWGRVFVGLVNKVLKGEALPRGLSIHQSIKQSINQSMNQSQPTNQPDQSISHSFALFSN